MHDTKMPLPARFKVVGSQPQSFETAGRQLEPFISTCLGKSTSDLVCLLTNLLSYWYKGSLHLGQKESYYSHGSPLNWLICNTHLFGLCFDLCIITLYFSCKLEKAFFLWTNGSGYCCFPQCFLAFIWAWNMYPNQSHTVLLYTALFQSSGWP